MGFHSCVGGCTGCINLDLGDNAGLTEIANFLNEVYLSDFQFNGKDFIAISSVMTRADLWAFAANEAIAQAARKNGAAQPTLTFSWGRKDCSKTTFLKTKVDPFPAGDGDCAQAYSVFTKMGMTKEQMVALIGGGHSMGETHAENSGYTGEWAPALDVFSNSFFTFLQTPDSFGGYTHLRGPAFNDAGKTHRKWQFHGISTPAVLLNTDVCMYWNIGTPRQQNNGQTLDTGILSCSGNSNCFPQSVTGTKTSDSEARTAVDKFASSPNSFNSVFSTAWKIMLANGNSKFGSDGLYAGDTLFNPCVIKELTTCCGSGCGVNPTPAPLPTQSSPKPSGGWTGGAPKPGWSGGSPTPGGGWNNGPSPVPSPVASWYTGPKPVPVPVPASSGTCADDPGKWVKPDGSPLSCAEVKQNRWCKQVKPSCYATCYNCVCDDDPGNWYSGGQQITCAQAVKFKWCSTIKPSCARSCGFCDQLGWRNENDNHESDRHEGDRHEGDRHEGDRHEKDHKH